MGKAPATRSSSRQRSQVGIRLDRRLTKVLKGLAEYLDVSLNDLVESILLNAVITEEHAVTPAWRARKARLVASDLKRVYGLDETIIGELIQPLMALTDDSPANRLFLALRQGQAAAALHLLAEHPELVHARDTEGFTVLISSARIDAVEIIEVCHAAGADLEDRDPEYDDTALGWAAYYGNLRALTWLIDNEASLNHRDNEGYSALANARRGLDGQLTKLGVLAPPIQFEPVIDLLLASGAAE